VPEAAAAAEELLASLGTNVAARWSSLLNLGGRWLPSDFCKNVI